MVFRFRLDHLGFSIFFLDGFLVRPWNVHELSAVVPLLHSVGALLRYVTPLFGIDFIQPSLFPLYSVFLFCSHSYNCVMKHNISSLTRRRRSYSFRRLPRSSTLKFVLLLFFIWDFIHCFSLYLHQSAALQTSPPPPNTKRIFIASQQYNSARLLREHWNEALYSLVKELGIENVFVSIYESGGYGWDETQQALRELEANLEVLQVRKEFVLSNLTHKEEIAAQPAEHWIDTPAGVHALRRIPFLSSIRNKVFEPLEALAAQGEHFDTILFLNDVAFDPEDVMKLLDTNGGDYAAACSLDFSKPPYFYDTFALRDSQGHEAIMQTWPYFRSSVSRQAAEKFLPIPVASCWNGMGEYCLYKTYSAVH